MSGLDVESELVLQLYNFHLRLLQQMFSLGQSGGDFTRVGSLAFELRIVRLGFLQRALLGFLSLQLELVLLLLEQLQLLR